MGTVLFMPESAYGPTNNCIGIGDVLRRRGHRVVFAAEASWNGRLEPLGFVEDLVDLAPPPPADAPAQDAGQFWKDFIRETAPEFRKPTIEQLETLVLPIWQELVDGARYVDERLVELFDELRPDLIVQDNVVGFPAVPASGRPWVRIVSCNPLELKDPALPPVFSGYASEDTAGWDEFRRRYRELQEPLRQELSAFCVERGAPPLPDGEFIYESPHLGLYLYPEAADYSRSRPLGPAWRRLDSCVRGATEPWEPPPGEGKLVYL